LIKLVALSFKRIKVNMKRIYLIFIMSCLFLSISKAQTLLKQRFKNVKFSDRRWTEPIGITSDKFLNCIGTLETEMSLTQVIQCLKEIEQTMGDSHENHQKGKVLIDIDLAQYGEKIVKEIIWL